MAAIDFVRRVLTEEKNARSRASGLRSKHASRSLAQKIREALFLSDGASALHEVESERWEEVAAIVDDCQAAGVVVNPVPICSVAALSARRGLGPPAVVYHYNGNRSCLEWVPKELLVPGACVVPKSERGKPGTFICFSLSPQRPYGVRLYVLVDPAVVASRGDRNRGLPLAFESRTVQDDHLESAAGLRWEPLEGESSIALTSANVGGLASRGGGYLRVYRATRLVRSSRFMMFPDFVTHTAFVAVPERCEELSKEGSSSGMSKGDRQQQRKFEVKNLSVFASDRHNLRRDVWKTAGFLHRLAISIHSRCLNDLHRARVLGGLRFGGLRVFQCLVAVLRLHIC